MKRQPLFAVKPCQCGGRPAWVPCKPAGRRGRKASGQAERLECRACGNATGPGASRELLAGEWNSAGWCGLVPDHRPFGAWWRGQMMRMGKEHLVALYEARCRESLKAEEKVREQRALISRLEKDVARLRARRGRLELAAVIDRLVQRGIVEKADAAGAKRRICAEGTGSRGGAEGAEKGGEA